MRRQCTAKSKRSGKRCKKAPVIGRNVCHIHGGKSRMGIAHYKFKGKADTRSKHLPSRMVNAYEEALKDQTIFDLKDDLALMESRLQDVLSRVDTGEAGKLWKEVKDALRAYKRAIAIGDDPDYYLAILDEAVNKGQSDYKAWDEVNNVLERRRKVINDYHKHQVALGNMLSRRQVLAIMGAILKILNENVEDKKALAAVAQGLHEIVSLDVKEETQPLLAS